MNSLEKRNKFRVFYKKAKPFFRFIHSRNKSVQNLSNYYGFYICPGGSNDGCNNRIVEIFWGHRPFDSTTEIISHSITKKFLAEWGAALQYQLLDNGKVIVSLSPAKTEHFGPIESDIFIEMLNNPEKLRKIRYLKKHWLFFKSYMNITSLEGNKNIKFSIITWYLRNFKNIIIDKKLNNPKVITVIKDLIKNIITVGLSGFLLFVITSIKECKSEYASKTNTEYLIKDI
jgi:hypothetical protein